MTKKKKLFNSLFGLFCIVFAGLNLFMGVLEIYQTSPDPMWVAIFLGNSLVLTLLYFEAALSNKE